MKKLIQLKLAYFAKQVLKKYKPEIIGITGSVGKTSTKEAILAVLKNKYNVRASTGNYNTELGVPLTILNAKSGGKNIFKWFKVFWQSWWNLILKTDKNYPEILILEMAADHQDDIKYLTQLAPCKIGVVTAIGPSHLEFFGSVDQVKKEKEYLVSHLNEKGTAILNADDGLVLDMQKNIQAKILTYGLSESADIKAKEINYIKNGQGIGCQVSNGNLELNAEFKNILSPAQLSSLLAAIAVGTSYALELQKMLNWLKQFKFPVGRLNIIPGIKKTILIDDTYNSSPKAVQVALDVLSRIKPEKNGRRWAILGDMLELGDFTEQAHQEVGEDVVKLGIDMLVCVGEKSTDTAKVAEESGMAKEKVICFDNSDEAKKFVQNEISQGDVILIKGSQGVRMEKITKEIMAEPNKAQELLVRQYGKWLD